MSIEHWTVSGDIIDTFEFSHDTWTPRNYIATDAHASKPNLRRFYKYRR